MEIVKLQIDPDNAGVFTYQQLSTWLESDDNKGFFSMRRTVQNIYDYLLTSKDNKFKTNAKELLILAAQRRTKSLLKSYTNIESPDKPSPVTSTPLNPSLLTPLTKFKPKFKLYPKSKLDPSSSAKSNLNPHSSTKSNPHSNSIPNPPPNTVPNQNPVKPYETFTENIDIQLLELNISDTIGELKLVRKVNKGINANLRHERFYLR